MENFNIYKNIDTMDIDLLTAAAGTAEWPKRKHYTVNCNGVDIKVLAFFTNYHEKIMERGGVDEYTYVKYQCQHEYKGDLYREDGIFPEDDPEITYEASIAFLSKQQIEKRMAFITAIANLINNQETIEAIVQAAKKKKNGELHKGQVLKIASSGVVNVLGGGYVLFATNRDATTLSIAVDSNCWNGFVYDFFMNDFVSIPHEGLKLSELIAKSLPTNH